MVAARTADVTIAGGGIIGLSLGLELRRRGLSVIVLERGCSMRESSWAAGGMLAARDPETPPELLPLALHSLELYPAYLERIENLSGIRVPLRTRRTLLRTSLSHADWPSKRAQLEEIQQWIPGFTFAHRSKDFFWLQEESLDPRDLCRALPLAFRAAGGMLLEKTEVLRVETQKDFVRASIDREEFHATNFVNCCGAWAGEAFLDAVEPEGIPIAPVKGQMVSVGLSAERLRCVLRTPDFYAIPRGDGRVAIGATMEQAGFDRTVNDQRAADLIERAACLLPEIDHARRLESWAGLRPGTPDGLPILGAAGAERCWHATGHYRDGILLAPGTARVVAQLICGEVPDVPLDKFAASRFHAANATSSTAPAVPANVQTRMDGLAASNCSGLHPFVR